MRLSAWGLLLLSAAWPAWGASNDHDIAVEYLKLQERIMAEQARFNARQAEARRLGGYSWAAAPDARRCAGFVRRTMVQKLSIAPARDPRSREAARLADRVAGRLLAASGQGLSSLCPSEIGGSPDYNAHSLLETDEKPFISDADEAAARTRALKAVVLQRGMILAAGTDDELAAVIGHELGHLVLQHLSSRLELAHLGDGKAFAAGLDAPAPEIAKRRMRWWGEGYLIETEIEADRFGAALMARAGYDPSAFSALLAKAEPTALRLDVRGEAAVRADFARRNAAAAKFAGEFPINPPAAPRVLARLKLLVK